MPHLDDLYVKALKAAAKASTPDLNVVNDDDVPSVVRGEMPDIVRRARKAGAQGDLTFIGAGMTAVVLQDMRRCWKVARRPTAHLRAMLGDEAEWLIAAKRVPEISKHIVRVRRFHPGPVVIERDCVDGRPGGWSQESKLFDLHHKKIGPAMLKRGWTAPEFKGDSYIMTEAGPVLVDGGMAQRVGSELVAYVEGVLDKRTKLRHGDRLSDLAFYVSRERGDTIDTQTADALLKRLPKV